jgi:hypothetical protein
LHLHGNVSTASRTVGPQWPRDGEIDIIEGVNNGVTGLSTLHTTDNCSQPAVQPNMTGSWGNGTDGLPADNCYYGAPNQYFNTGCGVQAPDGSIGAPFNEGGGGIYVTEIAEDFIRMFFFPRARGPPPDLAAGLPRPEQGGAWGLPYAFFALGAGCSADHFSQQRAIFDLTFCGDWAAGVFANECPGKGTCPDWVGSNPASFKEAYWLIDSFKVYTN